MIGGEKGYTYIQPVSAFLDAGTQKLYCFILYYQYFPMKVNSLLAHNLFHDVSSLLGPFILFDQYIDCFYFLCFRLK